MSAPTKREVADMLEQHRPYLTRVARMQLRDEVVVEDVVQETMLAALAANFSGTSSLRTWLTGILKHKIVDAIRRRQKHAAISESSALGDDDGPDDWASPFDEQGDWRERPADWGDPEHALNQRQFLDVLSLCMEKLPPKLARVFMMREYMDLDVEEICRELATTAGNVHVILFRARAGLRECMERGWLDTQAKKPGAGTA